MESWPHFTGDWQSNPVHMQMLPFLLHQFPGRRGPELPHQWYIRCHNQFDQSSRVWLITWESPGYAPERIMWTFKPAAQPWGPLSLTGFRGCEPALLRGMTAGSTETGQVRLCEKMSQCGLSEQELEIAEVMNLAVSNEWRKYLYLMPFYLTPLNFTVWTDFSFVFYMHMLFVAVTVIIIFLTVFGERVLWKHDAVQ